MMLDYEVVKGANECLESDLEFAFSSVPRHPSQSGLDIVLGASFIPMQ